MKHDHLDITIATAATMRPESVDTALVDAVANGRLFILNGRGEYEQVKLVVYWKNNDILTVVADGYEFNEDGEITRDWRTKA